MKIDNEVKNWVRKIFRSANRAVTNKQSRIPTLHETFYDLSLIESISNASAPTLLRNGWSVSIETHFLGSFPMFRKWEIADIGFLIMFRQKGRIVRSKVALLQSKRLYPKEIKKRIDYARDQLIGFGRLQRTDADHARLYSPRTFTFDTTSKYQALSLGDEQFKRVQQYQNANKVPVFYLFYNPNVLPTKVSFPVIAGAQAKPSDMEIGSRVLPFDQLSELHSSDPKIKQPRYSDIAKNCLGFDKKPRIAGWKLENFVADELLTCHQGYIANFQNDETLYQVFFNRSAPISAAIGITIDAPANINLLDG